MIDAQRFFSFDKLQAAAGSEKTIPRLTKLGFNSSTFSGAVTSGELAFLLLRDRPDSWWQGLGRKCLHFTWGSRGAVSLEGLKLDVRAA